MAAQPQHKTQKVDLEPSVKRELAAVHLAALKEWKLRTFTVLSQLFLTKHTPRPDRKDAFNGPFSAALMDDDGSVKVQMAPMPIENPLRECERVPDFSCQEYASYRVRMQVRDAVGQPARCTGEEYYEVLNKPADLLSVYRNLTEVVYSGALIGQHKNLATLQKAAVFVAPGSNKGILQMVFSGFYGRAEDFHTTVRKWTLKGRLHAIRGLLNGVSWIHSKGATHLRLEPRHIMLSRYDEIVIGGTAVINMAESTTQTPPCDTPLYQAPEVLTRKGLYDQQADVWSAALLCLEILIARPVITKQEAEKLASEQKSDLLEAVLTLLRKQDHLRDAYAEARLLSDPTCKVLEQMLRLEPGNRLPVDKALAAL
jgi:hypothetical protein